jgi:hypothetical protein
VLRVLQRHRIEAGHHQEYVELCVAVQRRAVGSDGVGMAGDFAVGQHDSTTIAADRIEPYRGGLDRDNQDVALPVHGKSPLRVTLRI